MKYICFFLLFAAVSGCKYNNRIALIGADKTSEKTNLASVTAAATKIYEDGTYCAIIKYYNRETETNPTCNLLVEVKNNQLTRINSSDCNWLSESNFIPKKLDASGSVTFTGNKGNEYIVTVNENIPLRSKKFQCDICGKEIK